MRSEPDVKRPIGYLEAAKFSMHMTYTWLRRMTSSGGARGAAWGMSLSMVFVVSALLFAHTTHAASVTLSAVQDSWLDLANPNTNAGADTELKVRTSPGMAHAVVQFDFSSIPPGSCVSAAALHLTLTA